MRLVCVATLFGLAGMAAAHQPRFPNQGVTQVKNPEVSQAYYAELKGAPADYEFRASDSLLLYLNLLVPDIPGVAKDVSAQVARVSDGPAFSRVLDGPAFVWSSYFEPFGGDRYFKGPELRDLVGPGVYQVRVFSPDNQGKYVLAIGKKESFPLGEIARTTALMPRLKKDFFGKSPFTAYFNLVGAFYGVTLVIIAGVVVLVVALARR